MGAMMQTVYTSEYQTPLGSMLLAATQQQLVGAWFAGQAHFGAQLAGHDVQPVIAQTAAAVQLRQATDWLEAYFGGERVLPKLPALAGADTEFRGAVRQQLLWVPYGHTISYGELAAQVAAVRGGKTAARAIGGAVGRNPFSVLVPCHRVLGADGSLTGYAGGAARKTWLLEFEQRRSA